MKSIALILSLYSASVLLAEESFEDKIGPMILEVRTIMKENQGKAEGKLDEIIAKLKAEAPAVESKAREMYLQALGELQMLNGEFKDAADSLKETVAASKDYDWGVWKKIVTCVKESEGLEAAKAEYDKILEELKDSPMKRDFEEMVGAVLKQDEAETE